jgi:hypothetical protein
VAVDASILIMSSLAKKDVLDEFHMVPKIPVKASARYASDRIKGIKTEERMTLPVA